MPKKALRHVQQATGQLSKTKSLALFSRALIHSKQWWCERHHYEFSID